MLTIKSFFTETWRGSSENICCLGRKIDTVISVNLWNWNDRHRSLWIHESIFGWPRHEKRAAIHTCVNGVHWFEHSFENSRNLKILRIASKFQGHINLKIKSNSISNTNLLEFHSCRWLKFPKFRRLVTHRSHLLHQNFNPQQIGMQQVRIAVQTSGNQFLIGLDSALKRSNAISFIRVFKWAAWKLKGSHQRCPDGTKMCLVKFSNFLLKWFNWYPIKLATSLTKRLFDS